MPLISGYVWEGDEQVTAAKLNMAFGGGRPVHVVQADIDGGIITAQASAPSAAVGRGWLDTSQGYGRVVLRIFDGFDWVPQASGFFGYNGSGSTIGAGAPVQYDSTATGELTGARIQVKKTSAVTQRGLGIAFREILNGDVGPIMDRGKVKALKDGTAVTAGDPVVPSSSTGLVTTGAAATWSQPFGSPAIGVFAESSAAASGTLVDILLSGPGSGSWLAVKSAPTALLSLATPSALATWQTAVAWSASPPGTTAHIIQFVVFDTTTAGIGRRSFGMRANGSSLTIDTGAIFLTADCTFVTNTQGLRGHMVVPYGTSDDKFQWYYDASAGTAATTRVTLHEVGVIVGGAII